MFFFFDRISNPCRSVGSRSDSMILRGPGAGAATTASGLFADLLKLSRTLVEWNIPKII